MKFVTNDRQLYPKATPVFPCIDPTYGNEKLFLTEFDGQTLIQRYNTRDYTLEIAPVRVGMEFDLYRNSNMNLMIQTGAIDVADTVSPDFSISKVFFEIMGELFALDVSGEDNAKGSPMVEGNNRGVTIDLGDMITINRDTLNYFGEKPYWLPLLANEEHSVILIDYALLGSLLTGRGTANFSGKINELIMGDPNVKQTKFAKLLKESTKVVAFTFKATIA